MLGRQKCQAALKREDDGDDENEINDDEIEGDDSVRLKY